MKWKVEQEGKDDIEGTCESLVDAIFQANVECEVGYWHQNGSGYINGEKAEVTSYFYNGYRAEPDRIETNLPPIAHLSVTLIKKIVDFILPKA